MQNQRLHTGFLKSAKLYPQAPAFCIGVREWTYAEVEDTARRWASGLLEVCGEWPRRVGIFAHSNEMSYIGILATLFAGAAFIPLNSAFPLERTRSMVEMAGLDALFVDHASLTKLKPLLSGLSRTPYILLPESHAWDSRHLECRTLDHRDLTRMPLLKELPAVYADALAYILFTSGSTGRPKGVPITHGNVTHFLKSNQQRYQITRDDRLTQTFELTFDLSIFDLFMAWGQGACVCPPQPIELLSPFRFVRDKRITVWFSVPSLANLYYKKNLLKPNSMEGLRLSLFCGEVLPSKIAEAWQAAAPHSVLDNLYGPTELTVACAVYRWHPSRSPDECVGNAVPIGKIYHHLHHLIVDEALQSVPPGEVGELCVAGPQTFPGYWHDSERTADFFFTREGGDGRKLQYYRTGDRMRLLESGNYLYVGRVDHQIKVRGHRVELGEVEAALRREPHVVEAAVIGWPIENGCCQGLTAFVSGREIDAQHLMDSLRDYLPSYMMPRDIHILETIPLNSNGKIDRKALLSYLEKPVRVTI